MKKNNIHMYKPNLKTKFRGSLAKKKMNLHRRKVNYSYKFVSRSFVDAFFTPFTRFYPQFLTFSSFVTLPRK